MVQLKLPAKGAAKMFSHDSHEEGSFSLRVCAQGLQNGFNGVLVLQKQQAADDDVQIDCKGSCQAVFTK